MVPFPPPSPPQVECSSARELGDGWVTKSGPMVESAGQACQGGGQATGGGDRNGTSESDALDQKPDQRRRDRVNNNQGDEANDLSDQGCEQYHANNQRTMWCASNVVCLACRACWRMVV
jgi:hypothetical protein